MSDNYPMNFHLKVNKKMETESEQQFWQKVLVASVNALADLESRSSVLRAGCHDVTVSDTSESLDFEDGIKTEFFWMTEQQLTVYYEDFISDVGRRIYRFAKDENVDIKLAVHVWWDDREPDAIVEKTLADMAGEANRADEAAIDRAQEPRDEASSRPTSGPKNIYGLRYANCSPNDRYAVDKTYAILAEAWLERLQGDFHGREPNDWVRNNREIMSAFEHSVAKNKPDFSLFEVVQYPCEHCAATVALREAHLVSLDSNGCPNHDGFPDYLCADCAKEAI